MGMNSPPTQPGRDVSVMHLKHYTVIAVNTFTYGANTHEMTPGTRVLDTWLCVSVAGAVFREERSFQSISSKRTVLLETASWVCVAASVSLEVCK